MLFAAILGLATSTLVWLGFRATAAWRASVEQVAERRASEKVALLAAALNHDMKGAALRVLVPLNQESLAPGTPHPLSVTFARAFARFPYPESFFAWRNSEPEGETYIFNRADRPPPWTVARPATGRYPLVVLTGAQGLEPVITRVRALAARRTNFVVFEAPLAEEPYQIVVHLLYEGADPRLFGFVGFTVNLNWVRRAYFNELVRQVSSIGGEGDDLVLAIIDDAGDVVASTGPMDDVPGETRSVPLLFFEPALLASGGPQPRLVNWTAFVGTSRDRALAAAGEGLDLFRVVISLAALATVGALLLTVHAVRLNAQLAATKTEFVSTVTHELKTPLSLIRLVADTLAQGRYSSSSTVHDYARLLVKESTNLALLVDNLLTYARFSDAGASYGLSIVEVDELLDDAMKRFHVSLVGQGFTISLDVPPDLPPVHADRAAVLHAFENLIDNAIRYSEAERVLSLTARRDGGFVTICVADRGPGIPVEERERVFEKFYRGKTVRSGGTGLGLAIVHRVVREHGGTVTIGAGEGGGTTVSISLPVAPTQP